MAEAKRGYIDPLIGLQRGDEGKGTVAYYYLLELPYDGSLRFNGGANAGHEIVTIDGKVVVLHQLPTSVLVEDKFSIIGNVSLFDPVLWKEEKDAVQPGAPNEISPDNLFISQNAYVVMPHHKYFDVLKERGRGGQGTTLKGIRYAAADQMAHLGGNVILIKKDLKKLGALAIEGLNLYNSAAKDAGLAPVHSLKVTDEWLSKVEESNAASYVVDVTELIRRQLANKKTILAEGAQGAVLDVFSGSIPFTSSSMTGVAGVLEGAGVGRNEIGVVRGVAKIFPTHVGGGKFVSKIVYPDVAETIIGQRGLGSEHGKTTGRVRSPGWLDLPAIKSAIRKNDVVEVILTKFDIAERLRLSGIGHMLIVTAYRNGEGAIVKYAPDNEMDIEDCWPILEQVPIGEGDISNARRFSDLSQKNQNLLTFLSKQIGKPIQLVSGGPRVDQFIKDPAP